MFTAKYSTTTPTNALRPSPGNVAISVDAGEDGPTSTTGWYNGFKIPEGGYLVIQSTSGNDPDYFPIANDTEMINLAKYTFGQSSISQIRDSLSYFLNNANTIVLDRIPNNVVTTDAFLNIDMSVLASFPSTDTGILDLSGNQAIGRVNNSPIYRPDQGVLDFDGVDDNISYSSPLCAGLDAWSWQSTVAFDVIRSNAASPYYQLYIEEAAIWIAQYANAVGIDMRQSSTNTWFDGNGGTNTGAQIGLNNILPNLYNHFTWTLEQPDTIKGYFNGELEVVIPTGQDGPIRTGSSPTFIGSRYGSQFFNGQMRDTKTYASTLTEEQVRQNFFLGPIVTDGLVLAMNAANLVSYNPGDTTTFSLRPSNIKQNNPIGTLNNGVSWSKKHSGVWGFDGSNDYTQMDAPLPAGQDFYTIESWWKRDSTSGSLVVWEQGADPLATNRRGSMLTINGGFWGFNGQSNDAHDKVPFTAGVWYHAVITVDSTTNTNPIKLYQNGTLYWQGNTSNNATNLNLGNTYARMGRKVATSTEYFDGEIGMVRVYDRILTPVEVTQNFEANRNRFGL